MKGLQFRLFAVLIMVAFIGGCTDKKLEDNLKSLERRVAQLEKKSGITPISDAYDDQPAVIAAGADVELPVMHF